MIAGTVGAVAMAIVAIVALAWGMFWPQKSPTNVVRWFFFLAISLVMLLQWTSVALDQLFRFDGRIQWGTSAGWVLHSWLLVAIVSFARFIDAGARWMAPGLTAVMFLALAIGIWFDGFGVTAWFIIAAILFVFIIFTLIWGGNVDTLGKTIAALGDAACRRETNVGFNWHGFVWVILLLFLLGARLVMYALQVWAFADPNNTWIFWIYLIIDALFVLWAFLCIILLRPLIDLDTKPLSNVTVQSDVNNGGGGRGHGGKNYRP